MQLNGRCAKLELRQRAARAREQQLLHDREVTRRKIQELEEAAENDDDDDYVSVVLNLRCR